MIRRETAEERKALPIASGVLDYFPDALLAVAEVSRIGNEQHNPGQPLHWAKEKSTDEADALMRHLLDRGKLDTDGTRHSAKVAWRALALLQRELEGERDEVVGDTGEACIIGGCDCPADIDGPDWPGRCNIISQHICSEHPRGVPTFDLIPR